MNDFVCFSCCVHYGGAVDSAECVRRYGSQSGCRGCGGADVIDLAKGNPDAFPLTSFEKWPKGG